MFCLVPFQSILPMIVVSRASTKGHVDRSCTIASPIRTLIKTGSKILRTGTEVKLRSLVDALVFSNATSHHPHTAFVIEIVLSPTTRYFNLDMYFRFLHLTSETVRYLTDNFPRLRRIGGLETWNPRTCDRESLNLVLASRPPSKTKFHLTT